MTLCLGARPPSGDPAVAQRPAPTRFNHATCQPSPALAWCVEHYWVTKWDRRLVGPRDASSLLDPCVHLQIQQGHASILGVVRGTYRMRLEGVGHVIGIKFKAGGFFPFVRSSVDAFTDRTMPAADVFVNRTSALEMWSRALSDAVSECTGDAAEHMAAIRDPLDQLLLAYEPPRDESAILATELVQLIARDPTVRRMRDLVGASGRSERTLQRLFTRYVGVSPAWVIRRCRLRAAAARLTAHPPADARVVACESGYADQAHFIRDFRATIGVTPTAYQQRRE